MLKTTTRYRVTHDQNEHWHDHMPSDEKLERFENFVMNRGGSIKVERAVTTIDTDAPMGSGRWLHTDFTTVFEIEG